MLKLSKSRPLYRWDKTEKVWNFLLVEKRTNTYKQKQYSELLNNTIQMLICYE